MKPEFELPTILTRYLSILIDTLLVLLVIFILPYVVKTDSQSVGMVKGVITLSFLFLYVPIFTSYFCTLGQYVMKIRVRGLNGEKINLFWAYLRFITKVLLGWISFFTVLFDDNKRAIHDYIASSIVIVKKSNE